MRTALIVIDVQHTPDASPPPPLSLPPPLPAPGSTDVAAAEPDRSGDDESDRGGERDRQWRYLDVARRHEGHVLEG